MWACGEGFTCDVITASGSQSDTGLWRGGTADGHQRNRHLQALIDCDGHVWAVTIVSGPEVLRQATLDAVKQWVYLRADARE